MPTFMAWYTLCYGHVLDRTKNALSFDGCMLDVEIKMNSDSESRFDVALGLAVWPHTTLQGHSGFCGEAMLCASTSSLCPMWETLRGPWHALWETPQRSRNRAELHWLTTFTHWNKWVFLILPAWWNQIIITGSITDTAVTLACMISKNSNPMLLFVFSSTHQLMNGANGNTNHTSRE